MATTEGETVGQRQLKLHQLRFAAKDLRKMPERERVFTMLLAHIANEINILQKLIMMAHNFDDEPEPWETQGRTAQTMCLLRVLVGKLNEAHRTVQKRYVKTGLHTQLEADLNEQPRTCFEHFMNYFDMPCNNINVLRKKVAFHNDWEFARKNIDSLPNDVPLFIYTDETVGNTLFHFADLGVSWMMSHHVKAGDFPAGLDIITDEAIELSRHFICFTNACLGLLLSRHVSFVREEVEVHSIRGLADARIPFFMTPS